MSVNNSKDKEVPRWFKKTLFHSRLPLQIFPNFKINTLRNGDGTVNNMRYTSLKCAKSQANEKRISGTDWDLLLGKQPNDVTVNRPVYNTISDGKQNDKDGDIGMLDEFVPLLDQESTNVTLIVYERSISINNGPNIPLPAIVLSANVLKANEQSQEDTFVVSLKGYVTLMIRFVTGENGEFLPFVVESSFSKSQGETVDQLGYNILFNSTGDMAVFSSFSGILHFCKIDYDLNGVPSLVHQHNTKHRGLLLDQFIMSITESEETIISLIQEKEGYLKLICLHDLFKLNKRENIMKNTFETPIHSIPLPNTSAVLFLQPSGYTVKSLVFCMTGDELKSEKVNYLKTSGNFIINSFYTPSRHIRTTTSFDEFTPDSYKHDQVLVSTSNSAAVYLLDVYYDKKRHIFTTSMKLLFRYKHVMSNFIFEPLNDGSFQFIFSNEMGITESKLVSIIIENNRPVLKSRKDLFSEMSPYPLFDFELINSPSVRYTIEGPSHELWAIAGNGPNCSLMNLKHGLVANRIKSNQKLYDINQLKLFAIRGDKRYILGSSERRTCVFELVEDMIYNQTMLNPIFDPFISEKTILVNQYNENLNLIITARNIILFDHKTLKKTCQMRLPSECIIAASYGNTIAILYKVKELEKSNVAVFRLFEDQHMEAVELNIDLLDPDRLSVIQFIEVNNSINLMMGDFDGNLYAYKMKLDSFEFKIKQKIDSELYSGASIHAFAYEDAKHIFVPYQFHCLDSNNNYLITSINGEIAMTKLHFNDNPDDYSIEIIKIIKLGDSGNIEIISTNDSHVVYLSCNQLWKLDSRISMYPQRVIIDESKENNFISGIIIPASKNCEKDTLLTTRNSTVTILEIPKVASTFTKKKRLGMQCVKLKYYSTFDLFIIITTIDREEFNKPKLLFAESRTMKVVTPQVDLNKLFQKDEYPTYLQEWKFYENNQFYTNLIVGCRTTEAAGVLKIFKLRKSKTEFNIEIMFSFKEDEPIQQIEIVNDNVIMYCTGKQIFKRRYIKNSQTLLEKEIVATFDANIRSFQIKRSPSRSSFTTCISVLVVTVTNISHYLKHDLSNTSSNSIKFEREPTSCHSGLIMDEMTIVQSEYNSQSIKILHLMENDYSKSTELKLGYIPRTSICRSVPPWVPVYEWINIKDKDFITVGLNGQIDLISYSDKDMGNFNNGINVKKVSGNCNPQFLSEMSEYIDNSTKQPVISMDDLIYDPFDTKDNYIQIADSFTNHVMI